MRHKINTIATSDSKLRGDERSGKAKAFHILILIYSVIAILGIIIRMSCISKVEKGELVHARAAF